MSCFRWCVAELSLMGEEEMRFLKTFIPEGGDIHVVEPPNWICAKLHMTIAVTQCGNPWCHPQHGTSSHSSLFQPCCSQAPFEVSKSHSFTMNLMGPEVQQAFRPPSVFVMLLSPNADAVTHTSLMMSQVQGNVLLPTSLRLQS